MRRRALAFPLLVLALLAAACTSAPSSDSTTIPGQVSSPVFSHDGTAVVAVPSLPTNFNPSAPAGGNRITQEVMEQVWPQTFVTDKRGDQTLEPGFVESAEAVSVSPLTITYTLNPAARWSDGVPITAADFIYNWHEQLLYASQLPDAGIVAGYRDIAQIRSSKDGHAVTVRFDHPFAEWESLFSNLVPAHIGERYGWVSAFQGFDPAKVISGGPFKITSVIPGKELVLSRNDDYWATKPPLSRIVLEVMPTSSALAGLESGKVSVAEVPQGPQDTNLLADAGRAGKALSLQDTTLPTLWQLCVNMTSPILQSADFRLGVEHALYPPEISSDSVGLTDESLNPDSERFALADEATSGPQGAEPWDPTTALGYLTSIGLVKGADGYLRPAEGGSPVTLSLLIPSGDATVGEAAEVIQSELQAIGITVVVHELPLSTMLASALPEGNYELAIAPFLLMPFAAGEAAVYSIPVLPGSASVTGSTTAAAVSESMSSDSAPTSAADSAASTSAADSAAPTSAADSAAPTSAADSAASTSAAASSSTSTMTISLPVAANANLPWSAPTPVGTEPDAAVAGVVTRDVFGLDDPAVSRDIAVSLTNLNTDQAALDLTDADTRMWQDVPTIPLFRQPVSVIHESDLINVSESPTWAGVFWDAEDWAVQLEPPIPPPTFPGVTPPSTPASSSGATAATTGQ